MSDQVFRGQKIRAEDLNPALAGVRRLQGRGSTGGRGPVLTGNTGAVAVAGGNTSATDIQVGQPVTIHGELEGAGGRATLLEIQPFAEGDDTGLAAVALMDIPADCVGAVAVAGICWAQTDGSSGALATPNTSGTLTLAATGQLQVLYNDAANYLALVRIGGGGGAAASPAALVATYFGPTWDS